MQRVISNWVNVAAWIALSVLVCVSAMAAAPSAQPAQPLKFSDLAGWWLAEPAYAGETSRVGLHLLEENGKPSARLSLFDVGGYEVPLGTVTLSGDSLDTVPYPFPLRYDAAKGTLSGYLLEAAVPLYKIPVEFHRTQPLEKPQLPLWNFNKPKVKWQAEVGSAVWAGLERDADTGLLFVGTDAGVMHAIDAAGSIVWRSATGKPIKARPAVIGDAVYVTSDSGYLYKLDKRRGVEQWRAKIDIGSPARIAPTEEKSRWDRYGSSVVADDRQLYVASRDNHLYALDIATGRQRWRIAANDMMTATPVRYGDLVAFAAFDGKVQAVAASDGKSRWTYDARLPVAGDLVVDGDRLFVGSRTYDLIALNAATGQELWKHYYWFSWIESPPVVRDQVVYTGSSDAVGIYAINAADGSLRWKTRVPGWAWARTAVGADFVIAGTVGAGPHPGTRNGSLVAIDRATGAIRWLYLEPPGDEVVQKRMDWGFAASPVIAGDVVYAADLNGRVYAFEM